MSRNVTAVLGPTNTGKTHLAIERMLKYPSGMIGLPLRLLAREVYAKVKQKTNEDDVALITGEEKITPKNPKYFVCTVEAMPQADVDFLGVDEVQLAADIERGHIFLDRIINMRGAHETMLLGASTAKNVLQKLLPEASFVTRPRLSHLKYAGQKKITRLPRRSAIVAFSADEVYAIAELVRRRRGAAAVVLGSLSPRTRNAQVELYQSGDVDFLVATDAIGMGLNLDVDHVAFAGDSKFDGTHFRKLTPAEIGQIAGRAGRHQNDGTFGVTANVDPLEQKLIEQLESHDFEPLKFFQWRNSKLTFDSIESLLASLDQHPPAEFLTKTPQALDHRALLTLSNTTEVRKKISSAEDVQRLWDVCQIPDYRRIAPADHIDLLNTIFLDVMTHGNINQDWFAEQVSRCDNDDGEIDALSNRIAHIRTWTFVSHRPDWLKDSTHWRERTREVEDKLSDALHQKLTQRFVDRRTSVLMKRLKERTEMDAEILDDGDVKVEGHLVGRLEGFRFVTDETAQGVDAKAARAAATKVLVGEIEARAQRLIESPNDAIKLQEDLLMFSGEVVARLTRTDDYLNPRIVLIADDLLADAHREQVAERLGQWFSEYARSLLSPLFNLKLSRLEGIARGIGFRLVENLGVVPRLEILNDVRSLDQEQRAGLRTKGVRFGAFHIYIPALLKPAPASLIMLLWKIQNTETINGAINDAHKKVLEEASMAGRTSIVADPDINEQLYRLAGFSVVGKYAIRIDIIERLADLIREANKNPNDEVKVSDKVNDETGDGTSDKPNNKSDDKSDDGASDGFRVSEEMLSILGATHETINHILEALGYRRLTQHNDQNSNQSDEPIVWGKTPKRIQYNKKSSAQKNRPKKEHKKKSDRRRQKKQEVNSPFGVLASLKETMKRNEQSAPKN